MLDYINRSPESKIQNLKAELDLKTAKVQFLSVN
jgi:hypothetical protein